MFIFVFAQKFPFCEISQEFRQCSFINGTDSFSARLLQQLKTI